MDEWMGAPPKNLKSVLPLFSLTCSLLKIWVYLKTHRAIYIYMINEKCRVGNALMCYLLGRKQRSLAKKNLCLKSFLSRTFSGILWYETVLSLWNNTLISNQRAKWCIKPNFLTRYCIIYPRTLWIAVFWQLQGEHSCTSAK